MTRKEQYLNQVRAAMTTLGQLTEQAKTLTEVHQDREYDSLALNAITDAELAEYEVVQYNLGVAVNILQDIVKLGKGDAILANPAARATINKWRNL